MSTFATKTVSAQTTAKPKMLSYVYLYRMYRFNEMKRQLEKLPEKISRADAKYKKFLIPAGEGMHYVGLRAQYYESKKDRLEKKQANFKEQLPLLAAKLNKEQKLSSFVEKQIKRGEVGFGKTLLNEVKGVLPLSGAVACGVAVTYLATRYSIDALAPSLLQGLLVKNITLSAIILLSMWAGSAFGQATLNARSALKLGREKAEQLVAEVKKIAA